MRGVAQRRSGATKEWSLQPQTDLPFPKKLCPLPLPHLSSPRRRGSITSLTRHPREGGGHTTLPTQHPHLSITSNAPPPHVTPGQAGVHTPLPHVTHTSPLRQTHLPHTSPPRRRGSIHLSHTSPPRRRGSMGRMIDSRLRGNDKIYKWKEKRMVRAAGLEPARSRIEGF